MKIQTEQEKFWINEFGNNYIGRNKRDELYPSKMNLFADIVKNILPIKSFIEFGSNMGINLLVLKNLFPNSLFNAVEINSNAVEVLKELKICDKIWHDSILNFKTLFLDRKKSLKITVTMISSVRATFVFKFASTEKASF